MPLENWIQHYEATRFFYDSQTLIVGIFAVLAVCLTIGGTARSADREIKVAQKQIDTTIRLAITQAAFEAIASTLPPGSVTYEPGVDANGQRYVLLPPFVVDRLAAMRGPGESYSDVILRIAARAD